MSINWAGFFGTALVAVAYGPQVFHLIKKRCSAGISLRAYAIWCIASLLLLTYAININNAVFIVLQSYQLGATTMIVFFTKKYEHCLCGECREKLLREDAA